MSRELILDPVTRIEGHAGVYVNLDEERKKVVECHCYATMFRGFEIILKNREPSDSIFITQRICGVCSLVHAYTSALANDMTLRVSPPPLAMALRNLADCAEILYDHALHLFQLAGPEYSEEIVNRFNKSWIRKAKGYRCEYRDIHGCYTMYELMEALNPLKGRLYLFALQMEREARKLAALIGAKHPHVNSFIPGGVARTWTVADAERASSLAILLAGFSKLVVAVWEDISNFLYDYVEYESNGLRPANLITYGTIDDPELYDAKYSNMSKWALSRAFTPGVVLNGELITTDLKEIHLGVREYVEHSFYDDWDIEYKADEEGNELAREHPWNKETIYKPTTRDWNNKYSWSTAPRWFNKRDDAIHVVEAGPLARLYITALAGVAEVISSYAEVRAGNGVIRISLPETKSEMLPPNLFDEIEFTWRLPKIKLEDGRPAVNSIERNRARAFCHAYYAAVALKQIDNIFKYFKEGKYSVWNPFTNPDSSMGVGLSEAARGALGHWMIVKNKKIYRYQVITPTAWNISPRDKMGNPGPMEEAIIGTPITEESDSNNWVGIDVLRVVRSYDPCLGCTVH